ncbi:hypothetical protein F5I97DRAFT_1930509 [Phlebopus sp. FC_14]|nr:hypothetical protein F5I97DRAFT_1930509 [Phlebopus sp. FC_14]
MLITHDCSLAQVRQRASIAGSSLSPSVATTSVHGSRPLRSSPLAGPAFSTLPSIISESSEESHAGAFGEPSHEHARSPTSSIVSHSPSVSASGYGTGYTSGNGSASVVEGEASSSSFSLSVSGNGHNYSAPPSRLSKSAGPVPTLNFFRRAATTSSHSTESQVSPQPAIPLPALTNAHGHYRSASLPSRSLYPTQQPAIPQIYLPGSPRPTSPTATLASSPSSHRESQSHRQRPSTSRDPTSNWLTSSPFGPAETPRFSRLALASPTVVMPLSAREYRKRKSSGFHGKGKESVSIGHVSFVDTTTKHVSMPLPASSGVSPSAETPRPASTGPERQPRPPSPLPPAASESKIGPSLSSRAKHSPKQPRSRPTTPRRPPSPQIPYSVSPKSSTNTFFSVASSSLAESEVVFPSGNNNDNTTIRDPASNGEIDCIVLPAARPRPQPRRNKSFPDRRSGSARLSLVDAMNRLSQDGSLNRLSAVSQTNSLNRLSVLSQASGNTSFYDFSDVEKTNQENVSVVRTDQRASVVLRSQSLEDISSTLTRTRLETKRDTDRGRDVRTVCISENVDTIGQPTSPRRRKLTKSRPPHAPPRTLGSPLRALTILPWISRVAVGGKTNAGGRADDEVGDASSSRERVIESPANTLTRPKRISEGLSPITEGSTTREDEHLSTNDTAALSKNPVHDAANSVAGTPLRRRRRYTFQIISAPSFYRTKSDKAKSVCEPPAWAQSTELDRRKKLAKLKKRAEIRSSTDSAGATTGKLDSANLLVPPGSSLPAAATRLTGAVSSRARRATVCGPNNNMEAPAFSDSFGTTGGESTPSLTPSGSTMTTSSTATATALSSARLPTSSFVPRPSQLKECFTDTSEDDAQTGVNACPTHGQSGRPSLAVSPFTDTVDSTRPHVCTSPRPGSSSSTTTTATTTSYASLSTIAASAHSSSSSPFIVKEQEQVTQSEISQEMRPCALCGQPTLLTKPRGGPQDALHPMFTVPLVTVTASSASQVHLDRALSAVTKTSSHGRTAVLLPTSITKQRTKTKAEDAISAMSITPSFLPAGAGPDVQPMTVMNAPRTLSARHERVRPHTAPASTGDVAVRFAAAIRARKATELSKQLQMRLQYAKLKVEHGWQRQNLNEVENLYFHHSHLRSMRPSTVTKAQSGNVAATSIPIVNLNGSAAVAAIAVDDNPTPRLPTIPTAPECSSGLFAHPQTSKSPPVENRSPLSGSTPGGKSESSLATPSPHKQSRPEQADSSSQPLSDEFISATQPESQLSNAQKPTRPPSGFDLSDPAILARLAQLQAQPQLQSEFQSQPPSFPPLQPNQSQTVAPSQSFAPQSASFPMVQPTFAPPSTSQPQAGLTLPPSFPVQPPSTPTSNPMTTTMAVTSAPSALTYDSFWSTHSSNTGPTRALYRTHTGFSASATAAGHVAMLTPGGHAAVMTAEGVYVGGGVGRGVTG